MELEHGEPDDFSYGVLHQGDTPLRNQPSRKCKVLIKPTPLDQGLRDLTTEDRQLLFQPASTVYKATHREQHEAGIHYS